MQSVARGHCPVQRPRPVRAHSWLKDTKEADPRGVFSVQDGLIRITGEGNGYLATRESYRDYHLIVEYKWGKRTDGGKFVRNSGILLHATGPDGGADGMWMSSIECQLAQGCVGDLIPIRGKDEAGAEIPVRLTSEVVLVPITGRAGSRAANRRSSPNRQLWWSRHDPDFRSCSTPAAEMTSRAPWASGRGSSASARETGSRFASTATTINECHDVFPAAGKILLQCEGFELFVRKFELHPLND